jgi:UDP-3-O-[3-hydroxymyristoyl] glucosamine N-acyltransferase
MKFPTPIPIKEVAQKIGAIIIGNDTLLANGINEIHKVEEGDITFSDLAKYSKKALKSSASIIILNEEIDCPEGKAILVCEHPFKAYDQLIREFRPFRPLTTQLDPSSKIHPSTIIEPGVVIAHNVEIGESCHIQANVVIMEHTIIGNNVTIQAGSMIGTDAFYFKKHDDGTFEKWRSGGRVIIEDNVDIGACCTINKGVSGDTIIGEGSKLDCQVPVGHGVVIGKNCIIAGQVGIGGKTIVEDNVILYGQVGLSPRIRVGEGAVISAQSGVSKSLAGKKAYFGSPADEIRTKQKELAALRHLPEFFQNYYDS